MKTFITIIGLATFSIYANAIEISDSLKHLIQKASVESSLQLNLELAQYYAITNFDSAMHYCDKTIMDANTQNNDLTKAHALKTKGNVFYKTGDIESAFEQYEKALEIYLEDNSLIDAAKIYNNKGLILLGMGESQKSIESLEKAANIYKKNNRIDLQVGPLINIGLANYKIGKYDEAKQRFKETIIIADQYENVEASANALANLATIEKELGNYKEAIENYESALINYIEIEDQWTEAKIYLNIGIVYEDLGQYSKAIEYTSRSVILKRKIGAENTLVNSLNKMGDIYCEWGKYDLALDHYYEAIDIENKNNDQINLAASLSGIGEIYSDLDLYDKALDNFNEALKIFEHADHKKEIAQLHNNIGGVYSNKLNQKEKASYHLNKAEAIFKQLSSKTGLASTYYNKAMFEMRTENYNQAIYYFNESINSNHENISLFIETYSHLANAYELNKEFELASLAYHKALAYKDSVLIEQNKRHNLKYETLQLSDRKSIEIERLKMKTTLKKGQENKNKTIQMLFIGLFIILILTTSIILYLYLKFRKSNKKLHKQQVDNEFQREKLKETNIELTDAKNSAEKISGYKSEFLANISHEIRTPLNAITGYLNLLQKQNDPDNKNSYIHNSLIASENLGVIINDLLDISKIEAGKMVIESTDFNPILIVTQAIATLKLKAEEKNIATELHFDPLIPDSLIGDPYRLTQILTNLISNAIKFSDSGQDVSITVTFHQIKDICELHFSIIDQGIGIANDELKDIFESFTQVNSNTARSLCGTGLGLAIVKRLIELQEGQIKVTSKENEGSKFSFHIAYPISNKKAIKKVIEEPTYEDSYLEHNILLVEDNEINQELAKDTILSWKLNFNIDIAENGRVAVNMMENKTYSVILMDIQMPEMDGHEATLHIRNKMNEPYSKIPIIGMTAHALPHEKELALKNGMNEYIIKPFNPDELKQKVSFFVFNRKI